MEPWKYRAIAAWGHSLGSQQYYIEAQQAQAAREGAPVDAIYKDYGTGEWRTMRDLPDRQGMMFARLVRDIEGPDATGPVRSGHAC
jgi:hypothetical protein